MNTGSTKIGDYKEDTGYDYFLYFILFIIFWIFALKI